MKNNDKIDSKAKINQNNDEQNNNKKNPEKKNKIIPLTNDELIKSKEKTNKWF